jgi:hypothetical protein
VHTNDLFWVDVTEHRYFLLDGLLESRLTATHDQIWCNAESAEFSHTVLGGFRLLFTGSFRLERKNWLRPNLELVLLHENTGDQPRN